MGGVLSLVSKSRPGAPWHLRCGQRVFVFTVSNESEQSAFPLMRKVRA